MQCNDQVLVVGEKHPAKGRAGYVIQSSRDGEKGTVRLDAMAGEEGGKEIPSEDVAVVDADLRFLGR